jgi:UDP-2-acetamido-2,6-beta-L-arabino-hexul-4-ose reductase
VPRRVVVTGANGFIGRNLMQNLRRRSDVEIVPIDLPNAEQELQQGLQWCDLVIHLAGVNRPKDPSEFRSTNLGLTQRIIRHLERAGATPQIIFSSSIQAAQENAYGKSKLQAETALRDFGARTGASIFIFRLPNVFGKWSRPYYNSVVATFCHQAANGEPLTVKDPECPLTLVYVDDVVNSFAAVVDGRTPDCRDGKCFVEPVFHTTVGALAETVLASSRLRSGESIPDLDDLLVKYLYTTYLSYIPARNLQYGVEAKRDSRGALFELVRSPHSGQIFVSRTVPGVTRGNHYHDTKVEKFCVVEGTATISLRHVVTNETVSFVVKGEDCAVVDIPPGYTHAIANSGPGVLVTVFWANEVFDASRPDTFREPV